MAKRFSELGIKQADSDKARGRTPREVRGFKYDVRPPAARGRDKKTDLA